MRIRLHPVLAAAFLIPACVAHAEPTESNLPLWEAGVGAAAFSTPAYPGADERSNRGLVLPFLIYRGKTFRADQGGIGARLLNTDKVEFDIGFSGSLPARSDDVDARRGMPDLGTLVEFGPRVKYKFADLGDAGRMRFDHRARRPAAPGLDRGTAAGVGNARRGRALDPGGPTGRRVRRPPHQPLFL
jgi:outer membrane protein